ncbi:MAG: DUF2752 domain-containing protein [bacterium]|nr:DUF2752 domain-containing protein [bacterium]
MRNHIFNKFPLELAIWSLGLVGLALIDPTRSAGFTLCPLHYLGFEYCPGCGLGRSISYLFHGDVTTSFLTHPLGIPAVLILGKRIYSLISSLKLQLLSKAVPKISGGPLHG